MSRASRSLVGAWVAVLAVAALGAAVVTLHPDHPLRFLRPTLFLAVFWMLLEVLQAGERRRRGSIMDWHRTCIAFLGLLISVQLALKLADLVGLIDAGFAPMALRTYGVLSGLGLAVWGNYLPKVSSPWDLDEEPFDWQGVHRFAGLLATLSGLGLVANWLLVPLEPARGVAIALVVAFALPSVVRKWMSVAAYSRRPPRERPHSH